MLGMFDCLYTSATQVHFQRPSGEWDIFLQEEGKTQGCPLSTFFAALVLEDILEELDQLLRRHAKRRLSKATSMTTAMAALQTSWHT